MYDESLNICVFKDLLGSIDDKNQMFLGEKKNMILPFSLFS